MMYRLEILVNQSNMYYYCGGDILFHAICIVCGHADIERLAMTNDRFEKN